jgi:hypothetical protein
MRTVPSLMVARTISRISRQRHRIGIALDFEPAQFALHTTMSPRATWTGGIAAIAPEQATIRPRRKRQTACSMCAGRLQSWRREQSERRRGRASESADGVNYVTLDPRNIA